MNRLPTETANIILERVRVDGVQPVSRDDFETFTENMHSSISNLINDSLIRVINRNPDSHSNNDGLNNAERRSTDASIYYWDGRMHPVPQGFVLPTCGIYSMWCLWHFGNVISSSEKYGAYSNLKAFDLPKIQGPLLSRIKFLMKNINDKGGTKMTRVSDLEPPGEKFSNAFSALVVNATKISIEISDSSGPNSHEFHVPHVPDSPMPRTSARANKAKVESLKGCYDRIGP